MLRGMSFRQFMEWRAYADMEPFDEVRADQRTADIVRTLINLNRGKRKAISLEDCVLKFGTKPQLPAEVLRAQAVAEVEGTMEFLMMFQGNAAVGKG